MKVVFKKSICLMASILIFSLNSYTFSGLNQKNNSTFSPLTTTDQTENEDDGNNNFNFIKSNENVRDFIYDGSLLFYGGIALIVISCMGIIITFLPRKHKKRRAKKSRSNKHIEK